MNVVQEETGDACDVERGDGCVDTGVSPEVGPAADDGDIGIDCISAAAGIGLERAGIATIGCGDVFTEPRDDALLLTKVPEDGLEAAESTHEMLEGRLCSWRLDGAYEANDDGLPSDEAGDEAETRGSTDKGSSREDDDMAGKKTLAVNA
jgi:hypothetical protein